MTDKTLILVGMGPGLSAALARRFAADGYKLGVIARSQERLASQAEALRAGGATVATAAADAGQRGALGQAMATLTPELGAANVLVYNAYAAQMGPPSSLAPAALSADLAVNAAGALEAAQAVLPAMLRRGSGSILFTGGGLAHYPDPHAASLSIGKAALRTLAQTLNAETQGSGVYAGTLTIAGYIGMTESLQPEPIAEQFHRIATAPPADGRAETWLA